VGKNKLARWSELRSYSNVIEAKTMPVDGEYHPVRGKWRINIFGNNNPVVTELGCGKGEYTTGLAIKYPECNFIGVDIKGARMWRGARTSNEQKISNAAFLRTRIEFIDRYFAEDEIDEIWITFPDPHPGKKNSNKRLTCPWFLNKYRGLLKDKGIVHLKTDSAELYNYTLALAKRNRLEILESVTDLHTELKNNELLVIRTHYENIFLKEGVKITYLSFRLEKEKEITDAWEGE
jgi:tRNA (guanine-N7-)-methyltransferase